MSSACTSRLGLALVLLCSALLSAALAHVAIDVLGDVLLPHDTYDGIAHVSRSASIVLVLAGALAFAVRQVFGALDVTAGTRRRALVRLNALLPRRYAPFALATLSLALVVLCSMEACDALAAGSRIDDLGDLFGGSILLGLVTLSTSALAVSAGLFVALAALVRLTLAVVRAVHASFVRRAGAAAKPLARRRSIVAFALPAHRAFRAGKRGPPLLTSLAS